MQFAKTNGIELAWDSFSDEAGEPMLLIAGLGTQMVRWTVPFCRQLAAEGFRVIRFDNRDAGRSTHFMASPAPDFAALAAALGSGRRPEVPYTLDDMATDTVGLMDWLGIERAHVVGRSMGGMIAQIMASEHPDRVRSLTSIMSSTGNPALPQAAPDVMAMMMPSAPDPELDPESVLSQRLAFARRIAGSGYPFDEAAHRALLLDEIHREIGAGGIARQIAAMAVSGDRRSRLATITAPTLVVHGTDDPLIPPACGRDTAVSIPGAIFLEIDGMGHDLPPDCYRTVIEAIVGLTSARSRIAG